MMASMAIADRHVCVVGLGYVGLTLAAAMADSGFVVHGLELRQEVLDKLDKGEPHFWEPRLREKLQRCTANKSLSYSRESDPSFPASVYVITVGTPIRDGATRLDMVEKSARQVAESMQDGALVILRSTCKLGTARHVVHPILESTGRKFDLAVCPERTLEGRALIELHELPQIIGADRPEVRARCVQLFSALTPTTVAVSSLEAAEMIKLVDNTYRDVTFGFANEIAKICSSAGLSAREIIRAGRLGYPRTNVALPGPVGGPCLEKDPHILAESALQYDVALPITLAARSVNERQPADTIAMLKDQTAKIPGFPRAPLITLAGLAFKGVPATDDLRGTMAKPIHQALIAAFADATFRAYDPVVPAHETRTHFDVEPVKDLHAAFMGANLVVIMNNHIAFQSADIASLAALMARPGIIYDYWNMHDDVRESMPAGVRYLALGSEQWSG